MRVRAINPNADPTPATYTWRINPLPDTFLDAVPPAETNDRTAEFAFHSDISGATFQCAFDDGIDSAAWETCTSPKTFTELSFGEHEFAVRAVDSEGNVDETPAEYAWEVGGAVPPVTIESGPAATTPERAATFNFSAEGRGLRYECALTTAPALPSSAEFGLCTSPKTYTGVPLGTHTFHVRVHAPEASSEPPISTYTWRVIETRPPVTTIDFGPASPSESTTADFAYSADEANVTFQCSLNGAPFADCPVPTRYTGLSDGEHTFRVRAIDSSGNVGQPDSHTWTIAADRTPPVVTINGKPEPTTTLLDAIFTYSANEHGVTFECELRGPGGAVIEPAGDCTPPPFEASVEEVGTYEFRVRATDLNGNVGPWESYSWSVVENPTPPETFKVDGPPEGHVTSDNFMSFEVSSNVPTATFECALDPVAGEPLDQQFEACDQPGTLIQLVELEPGPHVLHIRAVDGELPSGDPNADPTPVSYSWTVEIDDTPPETEIVSGPPATTRSLVADFQFRSNEGVAYFECALDPLPGTPGRPVRVGGVPVTVR